MNTGNNARSLYARHVREITTGAEFRASLRAGPYAWPGGYPVALMCDDGGVLCYSCARENASLIMDEIRHSYSSGWKVVGAFIVDEPCHCDHCGVDILE